MGLRQKFLAVMAVPVVVLVATTTLAFAASQRSADGMAALEHSARIQLSIHDVLVDLLNAETGTRGYLITGDTTLLAPYEEGVQALPADLRTLDTLVAGDPWSSVAIDRLAPLITERVDLLRRQQMLAPLTTKARRAVSVPLLQRGSLLMTEIRSVLDRMEGHERSVLLRLQQERTRADRWTRAIEFVVLPLGVLMSMVLVVVLSRRVVHRIRQIEETARRLEAGDALLEADTTNDEVGRLGRLLVTTWTRLIEAQGEMKRLATTDSLTGIANRRGFLLVAKHQLEFARREHLQVELAFIDVDGLKTVNDRLGHHTGDLLIQEVATLIRDTVRTSDVVGRVGGDEFCVLLTADTGGTPDEALRRLASALRWANGLPGRDYFLSVSVGSARLDAGGRDSIEELMERADAAMYEAKRARYESDLASRTA
jgi:diguanylate cyclase (GGDEF)-like protein